MLEKVHATIAQLRQEGFTDEKIKTDLLAAGYRVEVIDKALSAGTPVAAATVSQTGAATEPVQIENVQYGVSVKGYRSKPALVFAIGNGCLAVGGFVLATLLHQLVGLMFGFGESVTAETIQISVALLIPLAIVGVIALRRLKEVFAANPQLLEDMKFKAKLRRSFIFFLVLSIIGVTIAIFNFLGIFLGTTDNVIESLSFSLFYVGGLVLMTLWLYGYQRRTQR